MDNHKGSKFFDGLLWGAILGGAAVFFLGTPKGRKLFKMITEEGLEGLKDIGNLVEEYADIETDDLDGELVEEPEIKTAKKAKTEKKVEDVEEVGSDAGQTDLTIDEVAPEEMQENNERSSAPAKKVRRFFKGIPRKN